jgi:hypothetical protein
MKTILFSLILFCSYSVSYADYTASGGGNSKGEAYISAIANAPSGTQWTIYKISYYPAFNCTYSCNITWREK